MIGNDIIDLEIPISPNWNNSRFLNKLFSSAEQTAIFNSVTPKTTLQLFWSLKEAAYKAHQRSFNLARIFNPLQFQCQISSEETNGELQGTVRIGEHLYFTISSLTKNYIHSIATSTNKLPSSSKIFQDENALKPKLFTEYSLLLKEHQSNFSIQKNEHNIPVLFIKKNKTDHAFSLSHHGKYAAFAMALTNC